MNDAFFETIQELPDLVYVTSTAAMQGFEATQGEGFEKRLNDQLGNRLHYIPAGATTAMKAVEGLPEILQAAGAIDGVVILGDYATVPSRLMVCTDPALLTELTLDPDSGAGGDTDDWWTWNDDIYGNTTDGSYLPEFPVSRLPIIPGIVGAPYTGRESASAYGLRAAEFDFSDKVYELIGNPAIMEQSPPVAMFEPDDADWTPLNAGNLTKSWLYLVLHGQPNPSLRLTGTGDTATDWTPVALEQAVFKGLEHPRGAIFGGICWGGLMLTKTARQIHQATKPGSPPTLTPRTPTDSIPLRFVDQGANAFVGFATHHGILQKSVASLDDLTLGAPLHRYFWEEIRNGLPPATALFHAKSTFVESLQEDTANIGRAEELKTIWSATCIGFGW